MRDISDKTIDSLKQALRAELLVKRRKLLPQVRQEQSGLIVDRLTASDCFKNARRILLYHSLADEVSTAQLLQKFCSDKELFLPVIEGYEIVPVRFTGSEKMIEGPYGIFEPHGEKMPQESYEFDLIVVPGVAFDREGNRLGMGKGYYDTFLKKCSGSMLVALALDFQVVDKIPTASYDVPVSQIFTPNETILCKPISTSQRS